MNNLVANHKVNKKIECIQVIVFTLFYLSTEISKTFHPTIFDRIQIEQLQI